MRWIIRAYAIALLAYTGWRTYDLIRLQLPEGITGTSLAVLFLFSAEIGLLLWHETSLNHTTTQVQHNIATGMTWVNFLASTVAGIGDMILRQTLTSELAMPEILVGAIIYGLPVVVALNVAAVLLYLSNDSEAVLNYQKRAVRFEIHKQALAELAEQRGSIAAGVKKDIYRQLKDDITGKELAKFIKAEERRGQLASKARINGKERYNAETVAIKPDEINGNPDEEGAELMANPRKRGRRS